MSDINEDLRNAQALIRDPKKWTTIHMARSSNGNPTTADSEDAVCWCALGALHKVEGRAISFIALINARDRLYPGSQVARVNDELGHAAVMKLFSAARWGCGS